VTITNKPQSMPPHGELQLWCKLTFADNQELHSG